MGDALPFIPSSRATVGALAVVLTASTLMVIGGSAQAVSASKLHMAVAITATGMLLVSVDALHNHEAPWPPWRSLLLRNLSVVLLLTPVFIPSGVPEVPEELTEAQPPIFPELEEATRGDDTVTRVLDTAWLLLLLLGATAVLVYSGLVPFLLGRLRLLFTRRPDVERPGDAGEPVGTPVPGQGARGAALARSAYLLDHGDDRRQAVIAAYVSLEQHLEAVTPRRESETAREYVERALAAKADAEKAHVAGLLAVFGSARYSHRPVTAGDVERARTHLRALVGA